MPCQADGTERSRSAALPSQGSDTPAPRAPGQRRKPWPAELTLAGALAILMAALSLLRPNFLNLANLVNLFRQISINGILAVGVTYVLLTGGVDLSLGSVVALSGVVAASFAHPHQTLPFVPVLLGIAAGAVCGAANGVIVTRGRVAPFIATLGMMTAARGLALLLSSGMPVSNLSASFTSMGGGSVFSVPVPILIFLAVAFLSWVLLTQMRIGRYIYAVGGNENAARASGLHVRSIKMAAYTLCGSLAGLAGVVLAARITTGQPNAGIGYELDAIAAVVIGGTSLNGGTGGVGGAILGALLIGTINNGLDLLNVSSYYQQVVKGLIIVGAVWLDRSKHRA
ncbi:MAG TPA: ABC transporter permease [Bryobacteraceae bacterium]|nr:ABC transporter permease [Bryobacteraceae bacterium]